MPLNKKPRKRPKFYADENVFPESISFLRSKKVNILHFVKDLKLSGRDDIFHWERAKQDQRILLTLDRDFLNNRLFPLRQTWGTIVIVVPPPVTNSRVNLLLVKLLPIFRLNGREFFRKKKFIVSADKLIAWETDSSGKLTSNNIEW